MSKPSKERGRSSLPDRGKPTYEENECDEDREEGNNEEDDTLDDYKTNGSQVSGTFQKPILYERYK